MTKPCYGVGYGKPPLHTRFRKGQSGNPKGRGKGTRNLATIFMEAMSQSVTINENGKPPDRVPQASRPGFRS